MVAKDKKRIGVSWMLEVCGVDESLCLEDVFFGQRQLVQVDENHGKERMRSDLKVWVWAIVQYVVEMLGAFFVISLVEADSG